MAHKILIVEDEPLIAEDLAVTLKKEGYTIIGPAYDGLHALDFVNNQKPDLVLLDIALDSSMSGLEVAQKINQSSQTPFIFITSYSDKHTLDQAKQLFPFGYIVKPFKRKDILATIEITLFRTANTISEKTTFKSLEDLNSLQSHDQHITPKEYEIILDVINGMSNEAIAEKNFISIHTVKTHLKRVFSKLELTSRTQLSLLLMN